MFVVDESLRTQRDAGARVVEVPAGLRQKQPQVRDGSVFVRMQLSTERKTHKAVGVQRPRAASGTLDVAALAGISTEAASVALRSAHRLRH